ncbi:MAG TPA: STAS domain-containing protein [Mycobacterium sp.]|nr:STAS domain-containing protein [Mycobacterium sp.]
MNTAFTTTTTAPQSVSVRIAGDLDYETIDELVDVGSQLLTQQNELSDLHLDFRETTFVDSAALSGLLLLHRRTTQAGIELHLVRRPPFLDRVLQVTGLFGHFVPADDAANDGDPNSVGQASSGEARAR